MFVSQVSVMLSRTSSRVRLSTGSVREGLRDVLVGCARRGRASRRRGPTGESARPVQRLRAQPHLDRVADALREEEAQLVVRALLVGRQPGRRGSPVPKTLDVSALETSGGTVPGMLEWMPSSSGGALRTHHVGDLRAPVAALRDEPRVSEAPHQHDPGVARCGRGPSRSPVGLPENP